jgi:FkbM family methyltransferase
MRKNVYLDCGGHYGEGLREFIKNYNIDNDWIVETFEPNPECQYEDRISDIKLKNLIIHNEAVWIFDGEIDFSQEDHFKSKSCSPNDGKSNIDGWGSVITELGSTHLRYTNPPIKVPCIDFSRILLKYPKEDYNVIVKMDIEGAEFQVLRHIIEQGTIKNISSIYIEWHDVDLKNENKNKLMELLIVEDLKITNWK